MEVITQQSNCDIFGHDRYECALQLLNSKSIKKVNAQTYSVKSQNGIGVYVVTKQGDEFTCNCPDHMLHDVECKHILAVKELLKEQELKAIPKKTDRNWALYNLGQLNEGELVKIYLRQLVDTLEQPPAKKTGRPSLPINDLLFCSIMKVYGGKSSRRSYSNAREMAELNLVERVPCYNAINVCLSKPETTPILHHLVRMSALPLAEIESSFSIDSSGFRTSQFNEWCDNKHGKVFTAKNGDEKKARREHKWLKCHISCGNLTNVIADAVITDNCGEMSSDTEQFPTLLDNTTGYFDVEEICADKAYSTRKNYAKADELGVVPYLLFKKNTNPRSKGCGLWRQAFTEFMSHRDVYMEHYNKRNNVETTFGAIKQKMGEKLMSKTRTGQENELLCKIIAYNLTVLASAFFVHDIEVAF